MKESARIRLHKRLLNDLHTNSEIGKGFLEINQYFIRRNAQNTTDSPESGAHFKRKIKAKTHSVFVEVFDNNAGQYFEQGLWIDKSTFDQIIKHYNRLGHDISSLDKLKKTMKIMQLTKLTDKNFKKELNSLKELYNFLIDINSSGKMQTFLRYQAAFNCN